MMPGSRTPSLSPGLPSSLSRRRFLGTAALGTLACSSGCHLADWAHNGFKVGPNYGRPAVPVSSEWIDYSDGRIDSSPADLSAWWRVFNDPALDDRIERSVGENLTLRAAGARVLEARYLRRVAAGALFPQMQEGFGNYSSNKNSEKTAFVPPQIWFENWDVGLNIGWELDFWGRFRRSIEIADAELDSLIENYDDVLVLLLGEISTAYVELRTFQTRLQYAEQNVASQEQALAIAQNKFQFGATTERDVQQAKTVLEQTRALIPRYKAGARLANNRLCVLGGEPPRDLADELGSAPIPTVPPTVVIGIPADLVRRRPDVRRIERQVAAASARIGVAESELYPHITLNGTFGVAAQQFGDLFTGPHATFGNVGPAFRWDLLNYGRLLNNIRAQDARFQSLVYQYQQTVLDAAREAEDSIVSYLRGQEELQSLTAAAAAAQRTVDITFQQYKEGVVDFTAVFLASSELAARQDAMAAAQGTVTQSLVKIYQSLGGGWEVRLSESE